MPPMLAGQQLDDQRVFAMPPRCQHETGVIPLHRSMISLTNERYRAKEGLDVQTLMSQRSTAYSRDSNTVARLSQRAKRLRLNIANG